MTPIAAASPIVNLAAMAGGSHPEPVQALRRSRLADDRGREPTGLRGAARGRCKKVRCVYAKADCMRLSHEASRNSLARRGRKGGRKPVITPDKLARAKAHLARGLTVREAAARVKVGKSDLYLALAGSEREAKG